MESLAVVLFVAALGALLYYANKFNNKLDRRNREIGQQGSQSAIQKRLDALRARCEPIIEKHKETLARQYLMKVRKDRYGVEDRSEWDREANYFIDKVISQQILITELWEREYIKDTVDLEAEFAAQELPPVHDVSALSPLEFEHWCSEELKRAGWVVETTKASGDQGADVLARKGEVLAVIQCKLYNFSVGNKAVQESFAARTHYRASVAGVVTNAAYTRSALDLAQSTGVLLLHHSDLAFLDARLDTPTVALGT